MPQSHPRFGRALPARRQLLFAALLLSGAAALAYNPFGRAGAQDDADKQGASAAAPAPAIPGSGLDGADAPRRKLTPPAGSAPEPEAAAAPSKGDGAMAAATETAAAATEVTWRAADGPRVISGNYVIPAGTTVTVEPGVRIQIQQNSALVVEGALVGRGTADRRITITGFSDYSSDIQVPGRFEFEYTDISAQSDPRSGGTYTCSNCRYTGSGGFYTPLGYNVTMPPYVELRQTTFDGHPASLTIDGATVVLRDVAFVNGAYGRIFYSYVFIDNVRSDNSAEFGLQFRLDGRWYLNNIQVRNAALAALDLGGGNRGGDFHVGPNVTLAGSKFPVNLEYAGLLPGSTLPASGNTNNYIVADTPGSPDWRGPFTWAPQSIPYVVLSSINLRGGGEWRILPGTNVKFGPGFAGITDESAGLIARGLPTAPVLFDRFDPAQSWGSIGNTTGGNRYAHIRLEGSKHGINTTVHNGAYAFVEDLILSNNETGAAGGVIVTGTRFYNNATGYLETGVYSHSVGVLNAGPASPNSFEGNGVAVRATDSVIEARGNWWNSPTGPRHPSNPGGTGEIIEGASEFIPFLTARPDYTDTPPVVRQHKPHFTYEPGTKINITWDAEDDRSIVAHRILFNPDGNHTSGFQTVAEGLPGAARAYAWTVPPVGYAMLYGYSTVRVVSVDSAGHERFDDRFIQVPSGEMTGSLRITTDLAGQNLRPGQRFDVNFVAEGDVRQHVLDAFLLLDNDSYSVSLGGVAGSLGTLPIAKIPHNLSTDRARLVFRANGGRNRVKWFYGEYFSIRPDPRVGDAAPSVSVVSPSSGAAFLAGSNVRVSWSAFDDEGVRSFSVLASYDAGRSWHLVAEELPATATSYDLPTGAGAGASNVRVRVVATDRRFQQSSAETSFALTPTAPPNAPPAVRLQRPTAGSAYAAGATLNVTAEASDADGSVAKVEFFAGATLLGTDTAAPYEVAWQNVPAGTHTVVARATDNSGAQKDSLPVDVTVHAAPPPASAFPGATWGTLYNGPSNGGDIASIMALDASGNIHLTASSYGVGSSQDIVTIKYDPAGRQLWAARYGNPDNRVEYSDDIAVDSQGNVYVTGTAWRGHDFDGGTGYDFIIIKYDASGNQQWVRFYTGASDSYGLALEPDAAGNVYVTGSSYFTRADGSPANQIVMLKYDPAGSLLWTRTYAGPEGRGAVPVDLKLDSAGNPYVGGAVGVLRSNGATDTDLAVVKYDASGNLLRAAQYDVPGTNMQDFDTAIRLHLGAGGVFLIGSSWPDQCCEVTASRYDSVLLKFDAELGLQWAARFNTPGDQTSDTPRDLVTDAAGNVYVVGTSSNHARAGDAFTLKYDAAGKLLWHRVFEGSTYHHADAVAVVLDSSGGVQVGVEAQGAANYDYTLVRYLADGTQSGVRQFNGPANRDDILDDMGADAAGNVYLTGVTFNNTSGADLLTVKVAPGSAPTPTPTPVPTATPTPTPVPTTTLTNFALATNGGVATASTTTTQAELPGLDFSPAGVVNGDRKGLNWEHGGGWRDATNGTFPDWVQVDFNGAKSISEVGIFSLQDGYASPVEPTEQTTFTQYGVTAFDLLYWDGAAWAAVPGAAVVGNDKVWRKLSFSPVTTTKLRVVVRNALAGRSRLVEVEAWGTAAQTPPPAGARINAALASNGGVATASSTTTQAELPGMDFSPAGVINGDRKGLNWEHGGGWRDATNNAFPDWLEVAFAAPTAVDEIGVFSLQDGYVSPAEPTEAMTFTKYGVTVFEVQYWNGSAWATVPGGSVTNNGNVWRRLTFPSVTTTKIRVVVGNALAGRSRLVEVEAWGTPASAAGRVNHAAASSGGAATASSTTPEAEYPGLTFPIASVINGDRRGLNWEHGGGWRDATVAFPDWVQVDFNGAKKVDEVGVFSLQDNYSSPAEPTESLAFTKYGVTSFVVQYWDGAQWVTVPGGTVTGNSLVWRKVTFPEVTTTKVRVVIHNAMGGRSRLVEVEARGPVS
jgi:hypothetical protein